MKIKRPRFLVAIIVVDLLCALAFFLGFLGCYFGPKNLHGGNHIMVVSIGVSFYAHQIRFFWRRFNRKGKQK